jgi:hypothetical protein
MSLNFPGIRRREKRGKKRKGEKEKVEKGGRKRRGWRPKSAGRKGERVSSEGFRGLKGGRKEESKAVLKKPRSCHHPLLFPLHS